MLLLSSFELMSQTGKKMKYTLTRFSQYSVEPIKNQKKLEGKEGIPIWSDDKYMTDLINSAIDAVLSKEQRDSISLGTAYSIVFNLKGEVIRCRFIITLTDTSRITDDNFSNLYKSFKKVKFDMTKIKIEPNYEYGLKTADYARITGSMISKESRDRFNKRIEEKLRNRKEQNYLHQDSLNKH